MAYLLITIEEKEEESFMRRYIFDGIKLCVLFICCTLLFYFGLRALHEEYERFHRYDEPEGQTVKVFLEQHDIFEYMDLLFRLGE